MVHALVIEDEAHSLKIMEELLSMIEIDYTLLQDPTRLAEIAASMPEIDLVLLDLEMPGVDGYQVLEILRDQMGIAAPIVACTIHISEIGNARKLGFHSFIGKPLQVERFPGQIRRILNNEPVWEAK